MLVAMGYPVNYNSPKEIGDEMASLAPSMAGINYERIDKQKSLQWPTPANPLTSHHLNPTTGIGEYKLCCKARKGIGGQLCAKC
ncbi:MAG: hypothetical protein PHC92_03270, partial [Syntrophomonadaceae bacterium]|nr:hypothetical protein [Syntrophomonadaceae bacterium]